MGKGSGDCARPGISLGTSDSAKNESTLSGDGAWINTTLELQRPEHQWWTKDGQVTFRKRKEGWVVFSISDPICKAFREYGVTSSIAYNPAYFPSLKTARQAVNDVSLEAGLNIDLGLTRQKYITYKIGDLPLNIRRDKGLWQVYMLSSALPPILEKYFNSTQEFVAAGHTADIVLAHYPTRKAAHQAVTNWLAQTIAEGK